MAMKPNPRRQSAAQRGKAAAKKKSLADNSSGQRRVAVARKADPGSRGRKTTVIKGPKNSRVTPKIVESGVGNVPISLARLGLAIAKTNKTNPKRPISAKIRKENAKKWKQVGQEARGAVKKGQLPKGFTSNSVSPRQTKPPIKYGKR